MLYICFFFFSSRRRHTRWTGDWSSDVCSSDLSSLKPRCIGCSNCVLACPFGVPKMMSELEQMMKCDMCYDRTSSGKRPMCATVCPSQALAYVPMEQILRERREKPANLFFFGNEPVRTKVFMMVPPDVDAVSIDVLDYMWEPFP